MNDEIQYLWESWSGLSENAPSRSGFNSFCHVMIMYWYGIDSLQDILGQQY
jgi:hypothetical protein